MVNATFQLGPTLETERLILRPPTLQDFNAFAAMCADEETMRFLGGPVPRPVAWRSFASMTGGWTLQGFGMFSVVEKASGRWIGRIGPLHPKGWPGDEVGWGIDRSAWGKSYAAEAAACAIDWAFETLGWTDVIHCIDPKNTNSLAVARKLGSTRLRIGRLPPPIDADTDIYGQTREAWRARRAGKRKAAPRIAITAIDHVQITVAPELEREAKRFYGDVLGLSEIAKPEELKARGGAWYQLGNAQLHLAIDPGAGGTGSRRHVCLAVDDLEAARATLKAQGLEVIDEPIQADGLARFFLRDPAGNRVEIGQRLT